MTSIRARLGAWLEARLETVIARIHPADDAHDPAHVLGLTVERLPGGKRCVYDPMVPIYLERRRRRVARTGGDAIDRALAAGIVTPPGLTGFGSSLPPHPAFGVTVPSDNHRRL